MSSSTIPRPPRVPAALSGHPEASGDELHELRVRISLDLHRRLLALKLLRGRSLSQTVGAALEMYFAEQERARQATQETAAA